MEHIYKIRTWRKFTLNFRWTFYTQVYVHSTCSVSLAGVLSSGTSLPLAGVLTSGTSEPLAGVLSSDVVEVVRDTSFSSTAAHSFLYNDTGLYE